MIATYEVRAMCPFRSGPCRPHSDACPLRATGNGIKEHGNGPCPRLNEADVDDFISKVARIEANTENTTRRVGDLESTVKQIDGRIYEIKDAVTSLTAQTKGGNATWYAVAAIGSFVLNALMTAAAFLGLVKPPH